MHSVARHILTLLLWACLVGGGLAQDSGLTLEFHPWGRFKPGAWKHYRVVTETLDEQGKVASTSVTDTVTTLKSGGGRGAIMLRIEAAVEVAGKRLEAPTSDVKQGIHGEGDDEKTTVTLLAPELLEIAGRKVSCKVERAETTGTSGRTITKSWYSPTLAPPVLRRVSTTLDAEDKEVVNETVMDVVALNVPCNTWPNIGDVAKMVVVAKHSKGRTVTTAFTSIQVPGGVVCHTAEEFDAGGRLVRRSTLSLVDYGLTPNKEHSGLFGRIRSRGHRAHRFRTPPGAAQEF